MKNTISMYAASVPVFKQSLHALSNILDKTQEHIKDHSLAPDKLLYASLYPDMFNFIRQVQIGTDFAKSVAARLAGKDVPTFEDNETTIPELKARIEKTVQFLSSIKPELIDGCEDKEIITRPGTKFKGQSYLLHYGIPQFFFHITTAYDILRSQGVAIGKRDFMGTF